LLTGMPVLGLGFEAFSLAAARHTKASTSAAASAAIHRMARLTASSSVRV
jgi:hypothetical protein